MPFLSYSACSTVFVAYRGHPRHFTCAVASFSCAQKMRWILWSIDVVTWDLAPRPRCPVLVGRHHWDGGRDRATWPLVASISSFPPNFGARYLLPTTLMPTFKIWSCLISRALHNGTGHRSIRSRLLKITICGSHFFVILYHGLPKLITFSCELQMKLVACHSSSSQLLDIMVQLEFSCDFTCK